MEHCVLMMVHVSPVGARESFRLVDAHLSQRMEHCVLLMVHVSPVGARELGAEASLETEQYVLMKVLVYQANVGYQPSGRFLRGALHRNHSLSATANEGGWYLLCEVDT